MFANLTDQSYLLSTDTPFDSYGIIQKFTYQSAYHIHLGMRKLN